MKIKKLLKLKKSKKQKFNSEIELKGLQAVELLKAAKAEHSHWADHQHRGR